LQFDTISRQLRPIILGACLAAAFIYYDIIHKKEIKYNCTSTPAMMHLLAENGYAYTAVFNDANFNTYALYLRIKDRQWKIIGTDYYLKSCIVSQGYNWQWAIEYD